MAEPTPAERAALLRQHEGAQHHQLGPDASLAERLSRADYIVAMCDSDVWQRLGELAETREQAPDVVDGRDLTPEQRHLYVRFLQAVDSHQRAVWAAEAARDAQQSLIRQWDHIARPDLGMAPGLGGDGADDDDGSIAWAQRATERDDWQRRR